MRALLLAPLFAGVEPLLALAAALAALALVCLVGAWRGSGTAAPFRVRRARTRSHAPGDIATRRLRAARRGADPMTAMRD